MNKEEQEALKEELKNLIEDEELEGLDDEVKKLIKELRKECDNI